MKYWAILETELANNLAYPLDVLGRSFSILIFMWVFAFLWRATYQHTGGDQIAGLSLQQTLWYLLMTEAIMLSRPRTARIISDAVKDGSIAYLLGKPYNFLLYQFSLGMGESLNRLAANVLLGGALIWWLAGPAPDWRGWPLVFVTVILAWALDFCVSALIGLSAFVAEEISAFEWVYNKIIFLLGGMLIPLDFFPPWLQKIALGLPFAYSMYGPARLFVEPSLGAFFNVLGGQVGWLLALGALTALAYQRGVAYLNVNGG